MAFNLKHRWLNENDFCWKEALYIYEEVAKAPEAKAEASKPEEKKVEATPIEPKVFKEKYDNAIKFLNSMVTDKEGPQKELHANLSKQIAEEFGKIESDYNAQVNKVGEQNIEAKFLVELNAKAESKANEIEHRILIDISKDPSQKNKADSLKANLINHYLESKGYANSKEFATYLLKSDALPKDIKAEDFDKQMEKSLTTPVVEKAVKMLTEDMRNKIAPTEKEINYVNDILNNPDIKKIVGQDNFKDVSDIIAKRFYIEFKKDAEGKEKTPLEPLFAVDMDNNKPVPVSDLKGVIEGFCKDGLNEKGKIDTFKELTKEKTEKDQALFKKVTEGNTFLNIGKIDEISDIAGNKDLQVLLAQVNVINDARAKAETEAKPAEAVKPAAATKAEVSTTPELKAEKKEEASSGPKVETGALEGFPIEVPKNETVKKAVDVFMKSNDFKILDAIEKNVGEKGWEAMVIFMFNRATDADVKKIAEGDLNSEPSLESKKNIVQGMREIMGYPKLADKDEGEIKLLNTIKLENKDIKEIFGENTDMAELISKGHEIGEDKDKKLLIDGEKIETVDALMSKLPSGLKEKFEKTKNGSDDEMAKAKETFASAVGGENMKLDVLQGLTAKMEKDSGGPLNKGAEQGKDVKKMGAGESLMALLQLYGSLMAALKSGDYATLTDALKDFKEGKNPADSMKESKKNYTEALAKPDLPIDQLLSAYLEPRGEVANKLFVNEATPADKKESLGRYRNEAKPAILQALADGTGLTISSVAQVGDKKNMEAFDSAGKKLSIEFSGNGKALNAVVKPYDKPIAEKIMKDGKEVTTEKITSYDKSDKGEAIKAGENGLTLANIKEQIPSLIKAAESTTEPPKEVAAEVKPAAKAEEVKVEPKAAPAKPDKKEVAKK